MMAILEQLRQPIEGTVEEIEGIDRPILTSLDRLKTR